ncbi:hypothetical protein GGR28_001670 [Lewinella aquimaris]|uniref:Uncharacterized protein n=1 Tax=Neolewinella aquimaris TaxID=1835722 RepID=A0A840E530_9BACT|nr:hypothetical protein [Neolewinella aquimaris]MBB4079053.1 hypothetical protein [Neolewinella aquimaris]
MIRKSKINSLAELQQRKKQVRMETELAKREFAHSIGTTKGNAGSFLLKNVALPAGGAVVGMMVLSNLLSSKKGGTPVIKETKVIHEYPDGRPYDGKKSPKRRNRAKTLTSIIGIGRLLIPIIQAVIGTVNTQQAKEAAHTAKRAAVRK